MSHLTRKSFALGLILLVGLTVIAVGLRQVRRSSATFTTVSQRTVYGRADQTSDWLRLWSYWTDADPPPTGTYAPRRLSNPLVPAAEGSDEGLKVDLGGYPDFKQDFALSRVFTLETPANFPDDAITQVTVTATLAADSSGVQPLRNPTITGFNGVGNQATATLGPGQKRQFNVTVRSKRNFVVNRTYYPRVIVTVTFAGGPANYYYYDIPMAFTDAGQ